MDVMINAPIACLTINRLRKYDGRTLNKHYNIDAHGQFFFYLKCDKYGQMVKMADQTNLQLLYAYNSDTVVPRGRIHKRSYENLTKTA